MTDFEIVADVAPVFIVYPGFERLENEKAAVVSSGPLQEKRTVMHTVANSPGQHNMHLPPGQDVILPEDLMASWKSGPLPDKRLEALAEDLFCAFFPRVNWSDNLYRVHQDDARKQIRDLRLAFRALEGLNHYPEWRMPTIANAPDREWRDRYFCQQLANVVAMHIFGVPLSQLRPAVRADIKDYCDQFHEDAVNRFARILFARVPSSCR